MVDERAASSERLRAITSLPALVAFLRDELDWPIEEEDLEEAVFDWTPEEVGLDGAQAAAVRSLRQLRPLVPNQPWGIFYVEFEPKRLPVVVLRRLLAALVPKRRASAQDPRHAVWNPDDLLFIVSSGELGDRGITFAHFQTATHGSMQLRTFSWDETERHFFYLRNVNLEHLRWPTEPGDVVEWRDGWRSAFPTVHRGVIRTSRELSVALALVASRTRRSIEALYAYETVTGPLHRLCAAFRATLIHDLGVSDFADLVAQTISYGLFSARATGQEVLGLEHLESLIPATNPFLRELFGELTLAGKSRSDLDLDELGVADLVSLLNGADLDAVLMDFGRQTGGGREDPVIHFYQSFLQEYDPRQRIRRGVFYTPRPVVSFIVRSVHELLQTEFGLVDGLADTTTWGDMARRHEGLAVPEGTQPTEPFVTILDPATGTGTFLVEVIDVIQSTLAERWTRAGHSQAEIVDLWNDYVPTHLLPRLHGFELLMAPYAIAHLKIGLKLRETGYLFGAEERARIYLTNSLEPATGATTQMEFKDWAPALAHEAEAVNEVKRRRRFTVVIGNPPYSTISQNRNAWSHGLVDRYFEVDDGRMEERGNRNQLQDDYVKFYCLAQWLTTAGGVVGLITNASYLRGPWFRGMRYQLLRGFDRIDVLDLHGGLTHSLDQHEADENVFEIVTPVAIALLRRKSTNGGGSVVNYSDVLGSRQSKYDFLAEHSNATLVHQELLPSRDNQWRFLPHVSTGQEEWSAWIGIPDLFKSWGAGVLTNRNGLAVDEDRDRLLSKIRRFADLSVPDGVVEEQYGFSSNYQWDTGRARRAFASQPVRDLAEPYLFRPFDFQWIYWHSNVVYNMRGEKMEVFRHENPPLALMFSRNTQHGYYSNIYVTRRITDRDCLEKANVAPLHTETAQGLLERAVESNLSDKAETSVASLGFRMIPEPRGDLTRTCGAETF